MIRTVRLHRLYSLAIVAIWLEVVAGLLWMAWRRRGIEP
jgi:hypothetical protein